MKKEKGKYVLRSTYQKVAEENKKLLNDLRVLTGELNPIRIATFGKWRDKFKQEEALNSFIKDYLKKYLKEHPEYDIINTNHEHR